MTLRDITSLKFSLNNNVKLKSSYSGKTLYRSIFGFYDLIKIEKYLNCEVVSISSSISLTNDKNATSWLIIAIRDYDLKIGKTKED